MKDLIDTLLYSPYLINQTDKESDHFTIMKLIKIKRKKPRHDIKFFVINDYKKTGNKRIVIVFNNDYELVVRNFKEARKAVKLSNKFPNINEFIFSME